MGGRRLAAVSRRCRRRTSLYCGWGENFWWCLSVLYALVGDVGKREAKVDAGLKRWYLRYLRANEQANAVCRASPHQCISWVSSSGARYMMHALVAGTTRY